MKAIESSSYNPEFPESFSWGHVESLKFSELASWLSNMVEHDLRTDPSRNRVPGLRAALNEIAKRVDL